MNKLFSTEDFQIVEDTFVKNEEEFAEVAPDIEEYSSDLDIATERLTIASNELNLVSGITSSMKSKKLASVDYFTSMENYRPVLETIASNLGIKAKVPSLEDFKNPHGTKASHDIAMEGFFDYLKKIWDKIKDIFVAFFKKINIFFRRLFNAELELETYEEYLETMIAKIKAKKMTVSDNKAVIDSKLPSLLANPGMEVVDSDFILVTGENKIRRLVSVANGVFNDSLSKIAKEELKELHEVLKDVIGNASRSNRSVDEIGTELDKVRDMSLAGLNQLFGYAVNDVRNLPDTVYDAVFHHFDRTEVDNLRIHSLVDNGNFSESLPKNFNAYYALTENGRLFVSSTTETNQYTQNKLHPISNMNNLVKFYEFYKKISKELNIKRIDSSIGEFQDRVDAIVSLMKTKYVDLLEKLQKNKATAKHGERITTKEEAIQALVNMFLDIDAKNPNQISTTKLLIKIGEDLGFDYQLIENIVRNTDPEVTHDSFLILKTTIHNEEVFVEGVRKAIAANGQETGEAYSSVEDLEAAVKEYEQFQKFLLNYLNSLQVVLKEVSVNLAGTFTELRFELAKYIYNSAKLYTD